MFYSHKDVNEFVKYVCTNYLTTEEDVRKIISEAYYYELRNTSMRKTKSNKEYILQNILANCRRFLNEDRIKIGPVELISFKIEKLFFNSLKNRR